MLRLDTPAGRSLELVAEGDSLRMEVPGWHAARELMPRSLRRRRRSLRLLAKLFDVHGLTLTLMTSGKPILRLGHDVSPSLLSRLLGLAPARISLTALGLLLRR